MTTTTRIAPETGETEILQCLQQNDQRGFAKLYDRYSSAVFGLILSWIKDSHTAENLLQDVFIKAWRGRQLYDAAKGRLFTWLAKITQHICIDYLRSKSHKQTKVSVLTDNVAVAINPGKYVSNKMPDGIGLRKLVSRLSREEKEVIELKYFKGYTQKEIAEIINAPLGTVKTRMCRAIRNLQLFFRKDWQAAMSDISLN